MAEKGLPKVFLKRRMVAEAIILREVTQEMIQDDSPVALNGKRELDFLHTLLTHIDSKHEFGGLKCVSDGNNILWTLDEGVTLLLDDCARESNPDHLYSLCQKEQQQNIQMKVKDDEIAKLQKKVKDLSSKLGQKKK